MGGREAVKTGPKLLNRPIAVFHCRRGGGVSCKTVSISTKRPAPGGSRGPLGDPHGGNPTATRTATPVDPAKAQDALDDLFLVKLGPTTARMVLDSARRFYDAAAVSVENRAYAAFVIGNAYSNLSDRRRFCDWVDSARTRNPGKAAYQTAYQQCQ